MAFVLLYLPESKFCAIFSLNFDQLLVEGKVIEEARSKVTIAAPEANESGAVRRWGFK
jgi:hypothetical protein